ncbi:MAG: carbohydrate-binding protein [Myxococcota bacterium]|jgi:hypothetical protein|nr:carbohydrate-binding protein [Myxococcota bacterium]
MYTYAFRSQLSFRALSIASLLLLAGRLDAATYQAEKFSKTLNCKSATNNAGYSGTGFVDMGGQNSWFRWNSIDGGAGGAHKLAFRYASRDASLGTRDCTISVNGVAVGSVGFPHTGSWTSWSTATINVNLKPGLNLIQVTASGTKGGPNIDMIEATSLDDGFEALGDKKFAVVLLDYANDGSAPSVASIKEGMFDSEYSVANFIDDASYGKTTISGDVFGWIVPSRPLAPGAGWEACWPTDEDRFALLLKKYPRVNLNSYDGFIFYINRPASSGCTNFGVANTVGLEERETYTSFGVIDTRILYFSTDFYFPYQAYSGITDSTAAHEIIHALGIYAHSNSYTCGAKILSTDFNECEVQEYGDIFSIMGLRSQASFPDVVTSERLGWMDETMMSIVKGSGEFTINALEGQLENLKAIKIPLKTPIAIGYNTKIDHLYLEYRGMTGFDERNSFFRDIALNSGSKTTINNIHGVLIHGADCGTHDGQCVPYLLNMHPNSIDAAYSPNKVAKAYLYEGKSFKVPLNNIRISVLDVNAGNTVTLKVSTW